MFLGIVDVDLPMSAMLFRGHGGATPSVGLDVRADVRRMAGCRPAADRIGVDGHEHFAMLLAMAGVMLLRPAEYTHHHAHAR